ncbi:hypothetical protein [Acinetobacter pollinis]|uniref:Uncharacterized protein n=1 Tax=Acinetobacter pollinis TaxID=2605270 RepID=A0ABU6DTF6_9GAMM|nr:hypothetical protein [Acinetobacter pollinis]MEB5477118.1 hypothetical protein [Acinetobacter pollinis]
MGGKFVVRAGQHQFKTGEKIVSPSIVLPTAPSGDYSRKFLIPASTETAGNNIKIANPEFILGLNSDTHKPIFSEKIESENSQEDSSTRRIYADKSINFTSHLFVDSPVMNIHENDEDDS